ncbi:hypothetical protein HXX76_009624 [Chlamydomonas incerta]|uniref:Uncharacterized protein n=1 Tax=Chlamydomonas incerta TaxID=51695 RepID=A0A835SPT6_CHLIN|nr:hypothetical protein HXX76_009624 [Chlamydomonas incerta]|eukprot:KAG2431092.1 hypothetical protein HXX76_009624 [Chlamydomonas incerta]
MMQALNLLDVLRQLDVRAVDRILDADLDSEFSWTGARLACTGLRDFVDSNILTVELRLNWDATMRQTRRVRSITSLLARFRRCQSLDVEFFKAEGGDGIQHPSLLAALCVAGVGADVARNITALSLKGALDLPTLATVSLVLAGTLQQVHTLKLNTSPCGAGDFRNLYAIFSALRGSFPALHELCLPAMACLRGLEAFAGSALHTVRVMSGSPGFLRLSHVRSLLRLSQLRHIDLHGKDWDARWDCIVGDAVWDDLNAGEDAEDAADEGILAGADADLAALGGLGEKAVQELWALRLLLASAPPALERLQMDWLVEEVNLVDGRITSAVTTTYCGEPNHLCHAASVLLPPRGRRLPLLEVRWQVAYVEADPAGVASLLQPHTAFARLLAKCDRVELGALRLRLDSVHLGIEAAAAAAVAALQAVMRALGGGLPERLELNGPCWGCKLQLRPRCQSGGGAAAAGGRGGSGRRGAGGAAAAAPAAVMGLTAEQLLRRAADKIWAAASVHDAASVAEAAMDAYAAAGAADSQQRRAPYSKLERMDVLLRGPFLWQLTCGPRGTRRLTDWLGLVAAGPTGPPLPPQLPAGAAGATCRSCSCSCAACGYGCAMAVVTCDCPFTALQLHRAAAAAARMTPSGLQVSAAQAGSKDRWRDAIVEAMEDLWNDHISSAPQPAAAAARAAAAGTAARTCVEVGCPAGEPRRAPGGRPAGDAAAGGGDGGGDDDLQALLRLLSLVGQAHAAVVVVELDEP